MNFRRLTASLLCLLMLSISAAPAFAIITLEEERRMGEKYLLQIKQQTDLVEDSEILGYIRNLGARLVKSLDTPVFKYQFFVANQPSVNAFAIPGGNIFVFKGMILHMRTEAELASVMAHEIGHVTRRHIAKRMDKSGTSTAATIAGIIAGALLGATVDAKLGQAIAMGSMAGNITSQLAYSRIDEKEADYMGFQIFTKTGYPPQAMSGAFHKMWQLEQSYGGSIPTYMRSHPTSASRMDRMDNMAKRYTGPKPIRLDNREFERIQVRLLALYDNPQKAEASLEGMKHDNPNSPLIPYGLGLLEMRSSDFDHAYKLFESIKKPGPMEPYLLKEKGVCLLRMGETKKAVPILRRALGLTGNDPEVSIALGEAYMAHGEMESAVRVLRLAVKKFPDSEEALHQLGLALGRSGQRGEASLYLGLALMERGNFPAAKFHLNQAMADGSLNTEQREMAEDALSEMDPKPEFKGEKGQQNGQG